MRIIDPGHLYELQMLDRVRLTARHLYEPQWLRFVKRKGEKYPGNDGIYPGTIIQDVLCCCIDRLKYLDNQKPHPVNMLCIILLRTALRLLEDRAAEQHGREMPPIPDLPELLPTSDLNGHWLLWQEEARS